MIASLSARKSILTLALVVSLSGCASLAARPDPRVAEWQAMANATAKAYGQPAMPWVVVYKLSPRWGRHEGNTIALDERLLAQAPHDLILGVVAHELGHWVLGHGQGYRPATQSIGNERDANAEGVRVLVKLGRPQPEALRLMYAMLRRGHGGQYESGCDQIRDLLGQFPTWRAAITPEPGFTSCLPTR